MKKAGGIVALLFLLATGAAIGEAAPQVVTPPPATTATAESPATVTPPPATTPTPDTSTTAHSAEAPALPPTQSAKQKPTVAVIYHSRTGTTAAVAKLIAQKFSADLVKIEADAYPADFSGQMAATYDAWFHKESPIRPTTVDLSGYRLIFLGSPIWWFRPSPPLWTFVKANRFDGARVVLFNTFNSRFKQENIDEFSTLIKQQGGEVIDHVWVRRGREYNQKTLAEVLAEMEEKIGKKEGGWEASAPIAPPGGAR